MEISATNKDCYICLSSLEGPPDGVDVPEGSPTHPIYGHIENAPLYLPIPPETIEGTAKVIHGVHLDCLKQKVGKALVL